MIAIRLLVSIVLLAACGPRDHAPADGSVREASAVFVPDTGDPFCHWDCFRYHSCADGVVQTYAHRPIPCAEWTGSCPVESRYTCERGCRTDVTELPAGGPMSYDANVLCEENRPR